MYQADVEIFDTRLAFLSITNKKPGDESRFVLIKSLKTVKIRQTNPLISDKRGMIMKQQRHRQSLIAAIVILVIRLSFSMTRHIFGATINTVDSIP
jgi:hypothetical protein